MSEPIKRAARSVTSPVRGYINQHFEMVKQEVREQGSASERGSAEHLRTALAEIESTIAEASLHEARMLARNRDELIELRTRVDELERLVGRLIDVVAESVTERSETGE